MNSGESSYTAHLEIVTPSKAGNRETERSTKKICKVVEGRPMRIMEKERKKEGRRGRERMNNDKCAREKKGNGGWKIRTNIFYV